MKKITSILFLLLCCFTAHSQNGDQTEQRSEQIEIYFDLNSYVIEPDYKGNKSSLTDMSNLFGRLQQDSLITINEVKINSFASPEGDRRYNELMTEKRSSSLYDYLTTEFSIPEELISQKSSGIDWDGLYSLVEQSEMEYRSEVLYIGGF